MKVLIADDTAVIRDRIRKILAHFNGIDQVFEAENVKMAIKIIDEYNPEIILLDFLMPDGNGLEVLHGIEKTNNAIIIMLTNYSYPAYRYECIASGADYFFDKSTELNKVKEVFNHLFEHPEFRS